MTFVERKAVLMDICAGRETTIQTMNRVALTQSSTPSSVFTSLSPWKGGLPWWNIVRSHIHSSPGPSSVLWLSLLPTFSCNWLRQLSQMPSKTSMKARKVMSITTKRKRRRCWKTLRTWMKRKDKSCWRNRKKQGRLLSGNGGEFMWSSQVCSDSLKPSKEERDKSKLSS